MPCACERYTISLRFLLSISIVPSIVEVGMYFSYEHMQQSFGNTIVLLLGFALCESKHTSNNRYEMTISNANVLY